MKLKLDENLGEQCAAILRSDGHDVSTVHLQAMNASEDRSLIQHCATENRVLVTLDLDFSNPLLFPPQNYAGIAVLRLPPKPTYDMLLSATKTLAEAMKKESLTGHLWSVEIGRIRIYQQPDGD